MLVVLPPLIAYKAFAVTLVGCIVAECVPSVTVTVDVLSKPLRFVIPIPPPLLPYARTSASVAPPPPPPPLIVVALTTDALRVPQKFR